MSIQHMQMVFDAEGLTHSEKAILLAYCNYTDGHGYVLAGVPRISDDCGASERTVKRIRGELQQRGLLATKRRVDRRTGRSTSNITRINLPLLTSMKREPRTYDDNVIEELTFDVEDTTSDQRTCQSDTGPDQAMCQSDTGPGANMAPPSGGANMAPNPSDEPSGSSSSESTSQEEDEETPSAPHRGARPADLIRQATNATVDEAAELVEILRPEAKKSLGGLIRSMAKNDDLDHRLWQLRRQRATEARAETSEDAGPDTHCHEHHQVLPCKACKTAPKPVLISLLKKYGPVRRPDIAERLGAPVGAPA